MVGRVGPVHGSVRPMRGPGSANHREGMRTRTGIAVIGVGNEFRRDDGVGWAVVARLKERAGDRPLPPARCSPPATATPAG